QLSISTLTRRFGKSNSTEQCVPWLSTQILMARQTVFSSSYPGLTDLRSWISQSGWRWPESNCPINPADSEKSRAGPALPLTASVSAIDANTLQEIAVISVGEVPKRINTLLLH